MGRCGGGLHFGRVRLNEIKKATIKTIPHRRRSSKSVRRRKIVLINDLSKMLVPLLVYIHACIYARVCVSHEFLAEYLHKETKWLVKFGTNFR